LAVKDEAADVVGDAGEADFDLGAGDADDPYLHPHAMLLISEDALDESADL
jgi:hypothetical protein